MQFQGRVENPAAISRTTRAANRTVRSSAESLLADLYMTSPATVSDETASNTEEETTVVAEIQYDNSVVDEYEFKANNNEEIV